MAFFLFVAEFDGGSDGSIAYLLARCLGDGYIVRGCDERSVQVIGKLLSKTVVVI